MKNILDDLKGFLKPNDTIIVATSGGPDSMCLLHLLCELKSTFSLNLVVAHVNHKLRTESEEEALFVKKFSEENNLIYEYMAIEEYQNDNLENEARTKRYAFFSKLAKKYHANYIMTAHHGDDLIETILMRLVRGSSLKGYSGFHKFVNYQGLTIVRPLITVTKDDILEYMDSNHYKYYVDQTNFSEEITRNRYRKTVLPFLKKEDKNVHQKFLKFSKELEATNDFILKYVKDLLDNISDHKGIKISELIKLDKFLLQKVIEYILTTIYVDDLFLITDKHTELIMNVIKSSKSNVSMHLPNGYKALKDYDYFKIVKEDETKEFSYVLDMEVFVPNGKIKRVLESNDTSNFVIRLNSEDVILPLIVRSRKDGDKMQVKNLNGSKKIKDILIDEKINKSIRDNIPVVIDSQNNILWLAGVKKSKFDVEKTGIYDIILLYEEEK